jgi:hypothetical protein
MIDELHPWGGDDHNISTAFVPQKCQHCCERPMVKTSCQPAPVCEPVHAQRNYDSMAWGVWFKYVAYTVLGVGTALGGYSCFTKMRARRRVGDEDKDNWEDDEEDDARNRDTISENSVCFFFNVRDIEMYIYHLYVC